MITANPLMGGARIMASSKIIIVIATLLGVFIGYAIGMEADFGIHLEMPVWIVLPAMILQFIGFPVIGGFLFWWASRWLLQKFSKK